jgi:hypothetical protein
VSNLGEAFDQVRDFLTEIVADSGSVGERVFDDVVK